MVDYLGLAIFLVGVGLIVLELSMPGYFIGVAATALIVVGLIQMAWDDFLTSPWSPFVAVGVAVVATGVSVVFYRKFAPPTTKPSTLASDALVGEEGVVTVDVVPDAMTGKVKIGGIVWSAEAPEPVPAGARVIVQRVEGVHVVVEPKRETPTAPEEEGTHGR